MYHAAAIASYEPTGATASRLRVMVRGIVQGVGFRPFVYRLATGLGLNGWVNNSAQGVQIDVEGDPDRLHEFLLRLEAERPPRSSIQSLESSLLDPAGYTAFEVRESDEAGAKTTLILPDIATCPDCLSEIFDPADRRYGYPFTNCTNCGPRYSIIEALPYDRAGTTMRQFKMCPECQAEYDNPLDRRFHAQPNACPNCGPQLQLWAAGGWARASGTAALEQAADALRCGEIVAVKGLGGFHLMVDARNEAAVLRLRRHKAREEKPLALMFPSIAAIRAECELAPLEERLLRSPEAPIVLLRRCWDNERTSISDAVAPNNPYLGAMLPATPLHHLLLAELNFPVVATSGNRSEEPICIDERDALECLSRIADLFLVHNRPIARHVDDSIVRIALGRELVLRRARGYAPLPVHIGGASEQPILAVGAHLKNTVALAHAGEVFVSQHIGDLQTLQAFNTFKQVLGSFTDLYGVAPATIACDMHPDYLSTRFAERFATHHGARIVSVQHHYAHVLACMAENELSGSVLGVAWDGTGYGLDGTIWGGEWLRTSIGGAGGFERAAALRPFRLPGGEIAIKAPWRTAIGLLYEIFGDELFGRADLAPLQACSAQYRTNLQAIMARKINAPLTTSAGRLFDAIASLVGLRQQSGFEGQAAMELEWAAGQSHADECYPFCLDSCGGGLLVDWEPMVWAMLDQLGRGEPVATIAAMFHATLAAMIVAVAERVGEERVVLTGGCFQNVRLLEQSVRRLRAAGFRPYWPQRIPPNDGGIALGQAVAAMRCSDLQEG
jgi:hydrogenase maturation protein HypF